MNEGALELERVRALNDWTQRELAAHAGLDEPLISRLLRAIRKPNLEQALQLQARLGIDPALWPREVDAAPASDSVQTVPPAVANATGTEGR